jgi:endonuclease/exonuclease/phosphatase family metal-dependent hydrolase
MARKRHTLLVVILSGVALWWGGCSAGMPAGPAAGIGPADRVIIATWNVRGYPETRTADRRWFTAELDSLQPDVLCLQEIANQAKVNSFLAQEEHFTSAAFHDSGDGQDNAILTDRRVALEDLPDPEGFQHPAQVACVACRGFDAVVVTVHLSWTNAAWRQREKALLRDVVATALQKDPDVIVCGDFNTTEPGIEDLARTLGLQVMAPAGQAGLGTTHAGNRYDHFLVSPDLAGEEAVWCRIVTFTGDDLKIAQRVSDHLPVLAVFRTDQAFQDRN